MTTSRSEPAKCELCGKHAQLRPYGPNCEMICYECGTKNSAVTLEKAVISTYRKLGLEYKKV